MHIKVFKYNPQVDAEPYYVEGDVEYREKMTALEVLQFFHESVAPVNFDVSCATRLCGRCAMLLNGVPTLICTEPVEDRDYTFEPLSGFPVIRDLIVDKTALDNRLTAIYDRKRIDGFESVDELDYEDGWDPTYKWTLYALEFCCRCGCCQDACPVVRETPDDYLGPAAMVACAYRHLDPYDQGDRILEAVSGGLYRCIGCGRCDEVCAQQDIEHLKLWQILRDEAERRDLVPRYAK